MIVVRYYLETTGRSPFADWFGGLSDAAAAKVAVALKRIELGNLSNTKSVGEGVLGERSMDGLQAAEVRKVRMQWC